MVTLSLLLIAGVIVVTVLFSVLCALLTLPFALVFALLPFLVGGAGVVALIRGALCTPFQWEKLIPGGLMLAAAWLLFHF